MGSIQHDSLPLQESRERLGLQYPYVAMGALGWLDPPPWKYYDRSHRHVKTNTFFNLPSKPSGLGSGLDNGVSLRRTAIYQQRFAIEREAGVATLFPGLGLYRKMPAGPTMT